MTLEGTNASGKLVKYLKDFVYVVAIVGGLFKAYYQIGDNKTGVLEAKKQSEARIEVLKADLLYRLEEAKAKTAEVEKRLDKKIKIVNSNHNEIDKMKVEIGVLKEKVRQLEN